MQHDKHDTSIQILVVIIRYPKQTHVPQFKRWGNIPTTEYNNYVHGASPVQVSSAR